MILTRVDAPPRRRVKGDHGAQRDGQHQRQCRLQHVLGVEKSGPADRRQLLRFGKEHGS
jgi:hypothetical protein